MESSVVNSINFLKDEIINFQEIVTRNLLDENELLQPKCRPIKKLMQNMNQIIMLWHSMVSKTILS